MPGGTHLTPPGGNPSDIRGSTIGVGSPNILVVPGGSCPTPGTGGGCDPPHRGGSDPYPGDGAGNEPSPGDGSGNDSDYDLGLASRY